MRPWDWIGTQHREGEKQSGSREVPGVGAEVASIDRQRGFAVQFVEHVAGATGHPAGEAKGFPAAERAMGEEQVFAAQSDGYHGAVRDAAGSEGKGLAKGPAVSRQTARDWNHVAQDRGHAVHQTAAIDLDSRSEDEHRPQLGIGDCPRKAFPGGVRVFHPGHGGTAVGEAGIRKGNRGQGTTAVSHAVGGDFPGGGAAEQGGPRVGPAQLRSQATVFEVADCTEDEDESRLA